jgi:CheY-like chemotaxis protein/anti-sigma regulatory factor (Ser/Thr protein kinase)
VAHDFNNLLAAISGYGELLTLSLADRPDLQADTNEIINAARRASEMTAQLLAFSRRQPIALESLDLNLMVEDLLRMLRRLLQNEVQLQTELHPRPLIVVADRGQMAQVLMNLIVNARDAMPEGGTLTIRTARHDEPEGPDLAAGRYVRVTVADTGHGMAPEVAERAFEPFFTTKPAGQGTGLGLALVHAVVTEHHGFVDVDSRLGEGTTFVVWLPKAEGLPSEEPARGPPPQGDGEVVLAVDDEPEVLAALEEMLAALGYEPAGFGDSREALAAYRARPGHYEALVSDEVMPGLTGTQLAIELRRINPALPILIASGYGGSGFETRALSAGVNRVLKKPYRMNEIAEVLASFFAAAR